MNEKYKVLIIVCLLISVLFCSMISYSYFNSGADMDADQDIAMFIFNTESLDELNITDIDLQPGESKEYVFSVTNSNTENISDVAIEYQMTLKTYHFIPLVIELYKTDDALEELLLTCDETYTRNDQNELECTTTLQELGYDEEQVDNYKLKISFLEADNDLMYAGLVDYLDIEIDSWQK